MYIDTIRAKDIERFYSLEDTSIIDLRSNSEYEKSHIPKALNIPYEEMDGHKEEIKKAKNVILYCARGNLSLLAARELSKECDAHLISIGGGYNAYKQYFKRSEDAMSNHIR